MKRIDETTLDINDRNSVKEYLEKIYTTNRVIINSMMAIYDEGLVSDITTNHELSISSFDKMIEITEDNWGLKEDVARSALLEWVKHLKKMGYKIDDFDCNKRISSFFVISNNKLIKCSDNLNRYLSLIKGYEYQFEDDTIPFLFEVDNFDEEIIYRKVNEVLNKYICIFNDDAQIKLTMDYFGICDHEILSLIELANSPQGIEVYNAYIEWEDEDECEDRQYFFERNTDSYLPRSISDLLKHELTNHYLINKSAKQRKLVDFRELLKDYIKKSLITREHFETDIPWNKSFLLKNIDCNIKCIGLKDIGISKKDVAKITRLGIKHLHDFVSKSDEDLLSCGIRMKVIQDIQRLSSGISLGVVNTIEVYIKNTHISHEDWNCDIDNATTTIMMDLEEYGTFIFEDERFTLDSGLVYVLLSMGYLYAEDVEQELDEICRKLDTILPEYSNQLRMAFKEKIIILENNNITNKWISERLGRKIERKDIQELKDLI